MPRPRSSDDDRRKPPQDVEPGKLFRLLLRRPRPLLRMTYRLDVAEDVALYARALTPSERAIVRDADETERSTLFLSLAVCDGQGAPIFATPEQAWGLQEQEADELSAAVMTAHRVIAPTYDWSDVAAWNKALAAGAGEAGSYALMHQIAASFTPTTALKRLFQPRADRFFGLPLADITDGQRMAFLAAFNLAHPPPK